MKPHHDLWTWRWIPDPPAEFGDNPIFDPIRLALIVCSLIFVFAIGRAVREQSRRADRMPKGQLARFISLGAACNYIGITEMAVLGTAASPRLLIGLISLGFGIYGVRSMRNKQRRQPIVR